MHPLRFKAGHLSGAAMLLLLSPISSLGCDGTESKPAPQTDATTSPTTSSVAPTSTPSTTAPLASTTPSPVNPASPSATAPSTDDTPATSSEPDGTGAPPNTTTPEAASTSDDSAPPGDEPSVSSDSFEVDVQLASDVDAKAPTTVGIVTWTTTLSDVASAYVDFGLTTAYGMRAPVDLAAPDHRTLLLGMKPTQTYHFRVVVSDGNALTASDDYTVEAGAKTTDVSIGSFQVLDATKREPGFTIASYWSGVDSAVAFILDQDGEIVWAYDTGISGGIARARLSDDGKDLWIVSASNNGAPLRRVGIDGLGAETYAATVGSHDITPVVGATMAFIEYGESDCNSIFEIDPSGQVEEIWDSQELSGALGGGTRCHGNALRYSVPEGLYTYSDVSTDIVQVTRDGKLQWKLTELVEGGNTTWGGAQHGHQLLRDSILVFANSGAASKAGPSAVIEYALAGGAELWRYEGANGELSANLGDAQRLPGGNTLVTFSNDSIVHEVTPEREVVVEWKGSANTKIGYPEWRPSLYGQSPLLHD